jgi:pyruvate dehydrogenase E2 component (dihydrolipoamide acetyltransferase)
MPTNILMPALSPTMEKGNLAKWLVKEGDAVKSGDVIAEIETDKATMEVEAVDEGTVAKIVVPEGTADVPVNNVIAILAGEGEDTKAAGSAAPSKAPSHTSTPHPEVPAKPASKGEVQKPGAAASSFEAPSTGKKGPVSVAPQDEAAGEVRRPATKPNGGGRIFASPLAKRLAAEGRIDLSAVQGSGPHGRIVQRDIEAALRSGVGKAAPAAAPAATLLAQPSMSDQQIRALYPEGSYELVPHDSIRKIIAKRLVEAKQTIPHFYLTMDCCIDKLLVLRADINAAAPVKKTDAGEAPLYKLSVNDLVIKALAMALKAVPDANVTWTEAGMSALRSPSPVA